MFTPEQLKTRLYVHHKEVPEPQPEGTEEAINIDWQDWNRKCEEHLAKITGLTDNAKGCQGRGRKPQLISRKAAKPSPKD
eukprot:5269359-Heterocapsa_arctica.AAC.1